MRAVRTFSISWLAWTVGILAFAAVTSGLGGGVDDPAHWVRWIGGAMMVAAYPAGIAAHSGVVSWDGPWLKRLTRFAVMTLGVGVAVVLVRGVVGPGLIDDLPGEPATWSLSDRIEALEEAESRARATGTLEAWNEANRIGWEVDVTVTSGLTAIAFAWIGGLLGSWLPAGSRREIRMAVLLATGVFFLMTGYLMTENGYELLALKTIGPAYVVAWFALLAPGMAAAGLLVATVCRLSGGGTSEGRPA